MINFGIKTEKILDFLRGDVKSVTSYQDGKKDSQSFYNKNGDRTLRLLFDDNESISLRQETTFKDGHKTGFINYDEYNNRDSIGQNELNHSGQIISKFYNGECEEQYQYDEIGQLKVVYYPNTGAKDMYEYDSNNLAIRQLSIRGENSMFGSLLGAPNKKLTTFENDKFGNIIKMKVYDAESEQLLVTQTNKINSQGDEIESINLNGDGSVYSKMFYSYEYDNRNNWILKRDLNEKGNVRREQERQILYYN